MKLVLDGKVTEKQYASASKEQQPRSSPLLAYQKQKQVFTVRRIELSLFMSRVRIC